MPPQERSDRHPGCSPRNDQERRAASRGERRRSKLNRPRSMSPNRSQSTKRPGSPQSGAMNQSQAHFPSRNAGGIHGNLVSLAHHLAADTQRSNPHQSPSPAQRMTESTNMDSNWRTWPELTVGLRDVPPNIETGDLYHVFAAYGGEIVYIEILENAVGRGLTARVRFSPPPSRAFWEAGMILLPLKNESAQNESAQRVSIYIEAPRRSHGGKVQSPVSPRIWYPAVTKLFPRSMDFGVLSDEKAMLTMKKIKTRTNTVEDEKVKLTVDLIRKKIDVSFSIEIEKGQVECYRFHLGFSTLKTVYWHHVRQNLWALVIPTDYPPAYFWKRGDLDETFNINRRSWYSRDLWCRATDILTDTKALYHTPISLPNEPDDPNFINLGRWTTFKFTLENNKTLDLILRALGDFNINIETLDGFGADLFKGPSFWSLLDSQNGSPPDSHAKAVSLLANVTDTGRRSLPFEVRYQLEVCISRGIFSEYRLGAEFLQKLQGLDTTTAKQLLEHASDIGKKILDPMSIFDNGDVTTSISIKSRPIVYHDRVTTRKVLVTPTTVYLTSPAPEIANRILRKYRDIQDRFLRVQFTGELLEGRVNSRADTDRDDEVYKRVYRVLDQGIRVGDRHFELLAFGNSQMREHGAYFFAPTDHISCDGIRKSMGNLGPIRSVAKHAARMGQCFSTTREVRTVNVPDTRYIMDIEKNGYCFTDGVGKISGFLADMAADEMGLGFQIRPSAYQFRMGGCKGVLAVWPDAQKSEVHIRESQKKFISQSKGLEVIRCAQFASATLNRQTITILCSLGVKNEAFIDLLNKHLDAHTRAELNSRDAITLLRQHVDENQTTLMLAKILLHGFKEPEVQEPFVLSILNLWKTWSLKLIKEKARIPVEKSAFVLGCADETEILRGHSKATEGSKVKDVNKLPQIFLQVSDPEEPQKSTVITGVCIVGRNPSLHPGDIRVVEAVDVAGLRHLRDVVVFPTRGDRDVPSMLSGGDLDGDDFFVIWDPTLLPPEWNHPPMEHPPVKPKVLDRDVQIRDLQAFFVKYMKNDILPTVAHAHLALADYFDDGAKNEKCVALAQLHSKAVDYVKSGDPAEMDKSLKPRRWPTFMEKRVPKEMTYQSTKALGLIYERVHSVSFNPIYTNSFDKRILEKCTKDNQLLKKARQIKTQYDTALRKIMGQREIATEFEIWSGFVLSRPRVGSGYKLQEDIGREYGSIKMTFREMCQEAAGGSSAPHIDVFVAAMYKVTQEEVDIALHERRGPINSAGKVIKPRPMDPRSMPLISFPWIFHEVLCRLAIGTNSLEVPQEAKPLKGMDIRRRASTDDEDENRTTHLNDGRIVHRGDVLNLFELTEKEDAPVSLAHSEATTQTRSGVQADDFTLETQSEASSELPKRFPHWLKARIEQRVPGEPDARTLMMSQIEKDLADMSAGKYVKVVAKEASVVSAPEILGGPDVARSRMTPRLHDTKDFANAEGGKPGAAETEDLLDLSAGGEEATNSRASENKVTGQVADGELAAWAFDKGPGPSTRGSLRGESPTAVVGMELGMKHGKQGNEPTNEENRRNLSARDVLAKTAEVPQPGGGEEWNVEAKRSLSSNDAVGAKVRGALAVADPRNDGVEVEGAITGKADARDLHHRKGQKQSPGVVEPKESSAIDLLLGL